MACEFCGWTHARAPECAYVTIANLRARLTAAEAKLAENSDIVADWHTLNDELHALHLDGEQDGHAVIRRLAESESKLAVAVEALEAALRPGVICEVNYGTSYRKVQDALARIRGTP